jgi:hypothetical protein
MGGGVSICAEYFPNPNIIYNFIFSKFDTTF